MVDNSLETNVAMGFKLAALQLAIHLPTFRPQDMRPGMLWSRSKELGGIPLSSGHMEALQREGFDKAYIERRIFTAYEKVSDMNRTDAIYAYLKTVKDLPLYGCAIFNVTLKGEPRVLGVAEDGVLLSTGQQVKSGLLGIAPFFFILFFRFLFPTPNPVCRWSFVSNFFFLVSSLLLC